MILYENNLLSHNLENKNLLLSFFYLQKPSYLIWVQNIFKQDTPEAISSAQFLVKNSFVAHQVAVRERNLPVAMATLFSEQ